MKFLEDIVKKTLKKLLLKAIKKGRAPNDDIVEDTSVGSDKWPRANFQGCIGHF